MTKIIFYDKDIYSEIANTIFKSINEILTNNKIVLLGLPGGRSIPKILLELKKYDINWEKIHVFLIDERIVPITSVQSNYYEIQSVLSDVLAQKNLHPFIFNEKKIDFGIQNYVNELKKFGNRYNISLISSGEDGHIASLFPNHASINNNKDFFIKVENSPKPPNKRISVSKKFLIKSDIGILFFIGDSKKSALKNFLDEDIDLKNCPAKIISKISKNYVFTNIKNIS